MTHKQIAIIKKLLAGRREAVILDMGDRRRLVTHNGNCRYSEYYNLTAIVASPNVTYRS